MEDLRKSLDVEIKRNSTLKEFAEKY